MENWSDFDSEASYAVHDDEREWSQDQFTGILHSSGTVSFREGL